MAERSVRHLDLASRATLPPSMVAAQPSLAKGEPFEALREILRELLEDVRRAETLVDVNIAAGLAFEALRQLT